MITCSPSTGAHSSKLHTSCPGEAEVNEWLVKKSLIAAHKEQNILLGSFQTKPGVKQQSILDFI